MQLEWTPRVVTSALHAARAIARGQQLVDAQLTQTLSPAVESLAAAAAFLEVPITRVFAHLLPLSATLNSTRELAAVTLKKMALKKVALPKGPPDVQDVLAEALAALLAAFRQAAPAAEDELTLRIDPLRWNWEARGPGLLVGVKRLLPADVLVPSASVLLVQPVLGGGGGAHWNYNLVHFEAMLANPVAELPEVMRLGWLLSQLNFDRPGLAGTLEPHRLEQIGPAALLPAVLTAADDVDLARASVETVARASALWLDEPVDATMLWAWWETYLATRPTWEVALGALDAMWTA